MLSQADILELVIRGAAAGVNILGAILIMQSQAPLIRRMLACLFLSSLVIYVLLSAPDAVNVFGPLRPAVKVVAIFNSVFFWWFALSLFDDAFRLTWRKLVPFFLVAVMHLTLLVWSGEAIKSLEELAHAVLSAGLMGHAVWVALKSRTDDLVSPRRRFRVFFAVGVGAAGIVITVAEFVDSLKELPAAAGLLHALALAALTFYFCTWILAANRSFFANEEKPAPDLGTARPTLDDPVHRRLKAVMDEGAYREEGLTVAKLAEKVGVPEHQLRRLINKELGFRNFSAFLNARRIEDAKTALADPQNIKKQVLQIALDLGYGSIAPFNRAFKDATGKTPTEFRRDMLERD
ncbi:MAG: AraC family transcriptional regulator [Pseudomonadota bacterium]